ncbi:hypothetical protein PS726_00419 [Pseudomonas fluorescens]|uniref:AAA domain-containing protein n=1 Tax=Pseudomonas fluorescens TaxID=294 RepID=A0A5E6ZYZ3_PSEFL|nr:DUF3696 domain-containing protein [Pseudomonas fluorescens]VVN71075.1 hypothetical protein PS726_00419 [Pseudomonas fluorescens]VVP26747.1 hypothetical protein PS862_04144 [Pseudomonas fluorescens]
MFKNIGINNFKGFSQPQRIRLAPVTLIYGPNSSGKSSIIQALMLLKQSITRPSEKGGLVSTGEYIDLGTFSSMMNNHNTQNDLEFSVEYSPLKRQSSAERTNFGDSHNRIHEFTYSLSGRESNHKNEEFTYLKKITTKIVTEGNSKSLFKLSMQSSLDDKIQTNFIRRSLAARTFDFADADSSESFCNYVSRKTGVTGFDSNPVRKLINNITFRSDPNFCTPSSIIIKESQKDVDNVAFAVCNQTITEIATELQDKFGTVAYLGPLRLHPARLYAPKGDQSGSVGKAGENAARLIYEKSPGMSDEINRWFLEFDIPYSLSAENIGNDITGSVVSLQLKDLRTGVTVGPSDVGFGIGQLLPILVEGLVRKNSTICVEQPEIHLHPRLQAALANFIIETSKENQWIIETHSESLILRLQNKIKDGTISPNDVSVIYVEATSRGSKVLEIPLDKDGDFMVDWPDGFFEERLKELFGKKS